ncbi:YciI family protein [Sphingomonas phyllosphaerae]|uniref:YciI family protein n=1 Tax=Sphingomonas phyllosphaerae TaxID=257003 RepID=UPI000687B60F|nr:YciI family protein [Sphingomonas phyllosphaerae]
MTTAVTTSDPSAVGPTPLLFVAVLTYLRPLEDMDEAGPDHVAWLRRGYDAGRLLASGRRVPRTGGVIIARGTDVAEVEAYLRTDPFQQRGLAVADIYPFEAVMLTDPMRAALATV